MKAFPKYITTQVQSVLLSAAFCVTSLACLAQAQTNAVQANATQTNAPGLAQQVGATASEVTQTTLNQVESLWKRIDERRLKNRTPDELVAWALMGLLVGGLVYRFSHLSQVTTILIGLVGAFIGGILANVFQIDLGMGPVLIRYEDLLCSLIGGLGLFFVWKWLKGRMAPATAPKADASKAATSKTAATK
jgi:uncharacterized membrane protein YeaQ/YmgE (transglycosylase-associated protein family)